MNIKPAYKTLIAVFLLLGMAATRLSAQNYPITITLFPAHPSQPYPTDAMVYVNDPMSVFGVQITNTTNRPIEVYLDFDLSCSISNGFTNYRVYTDNTYVTEAHCISIDPGTHTLTPDDFNITMARRVRTAITSEQLLSMLILPEGEYKFCMTAQYCQAQISQNGSDNRQASDESCISFQICYSGSAPEFMAPIVIDDGDAAPKLIPQRKTSFSWIGVVHNCMEAPDYKYLLKFVEVYPNQTPQYAVENNPVIASINRGHSTYYIHDYLTDPYVAFDSGMRYAAQVEAYVDDDVPISLTNDGKSEVLSFIWMGPSSTDGTGSKGPANSSSRKKGKKGKEDVFSGKRDIRSYKERGNRQEAMAAIVPGTIVSPDSDSDVGDSLLPFRITWTPASGPSLASADFKVSLYEAVDTVDEATGEQVTVPKGKALKTVTVHQPATPPATLEASGFDIVLANNKYYIAEVATLAAFTFDARFRITEIKYINGYPETRRTDSLATGPDTVTLTSRVPFRWVGHTTNMPSGSPKLMQFSQKDTLTLTCNYDPAGPAIELEWVCGSNIGADYSGVIYRSVDGGAPEPIATVTPQDRRYRDAKLPTGRYAVYHVQLTFGKGEGSFKSKPTSCVIGN